MNYKQFRRVAFTLVLSCVFTFTVYAKFWGTETTTTTHTAADGGCWEYTTETYYVFWVPVSSSGSWEPC